MAETPPGGATPDLPYDLVTHGVYPNVQRLMEGRVEYNTVTCAEISQGSWAIDTKPKAGTTAFGTVTGQLSNGDCPGITFIFGALFYTWTSTNPAVLSDTLSATWTSPDFLVTDTFDINLIHLQINLVSPPANNQYVIDATPTMPVVEATAQVVNAIPDPTATTQFTWTASLKVRKGTGQTVDYSSSLKQSVMTTGTAKYTLTTTNPATLVGWLPGCGRA